MIQRNVIDWLEASASKHPEKNAFETEHESISRGVGKFLLFYSEALLMLLLSIMYCGSKSGPLTQMICYVGKNSLLFLIVHTIEYECLPWGGFIRALGLPEIPELGNMLCFAFRTAGCAVMVRLMERPFTRMITRVSRL